MQVKQARNLLPEMDLSQYPELSGRESELAAPKKLLQTAVVWADFPVISQDADLIVLSGNFSVRSQYLQQVMAEAKKITIGCVTLGPQIGKYISQRMEAGEYYLAALADSFASHYVEMLTEKWVGQRKKEQVSRGLFPTMRFSPGYGDFALSNQYQIIELLGLEKEITVTESYLLEPEKTITFILGWCERPQPQTYPEEMPLLTKRKRESCPGDGNCNYCTTRACLR